MFSRIIALDNQLRKAGIPIHGCSSDGRIDFKPEATKSQKAQAQSIVDGFDWNELVLKTPETLRGELALLPQESLNVLLSAMVAERMQKDPSFAEKLGVNVKGLLKEDLARMQELPPEE